MSKIDTGVRSLSPYGFVQIVHIVQIVHFVHFDTFRAECVDLCGMCYRDREILSKIPFVARGANESMKRSRAALVLLQILMIAKDLLDKVAADGATIFVYDASGVLIAEYSAEVSQEPRVSYLTTDHLGSPRVVTDERGSVASRRDFMPFGEEINGVGGRTTGLNYGSDPIRQKFTGYERDAESDLDFAQARYYNSSHGRFTSVDPLTASATIRNPQTFNRYSYGLNSPYKFTDPLGLAPEGYWQTNYDSSGACSAAAEACNDTWDPRLDSSNFRYSFAPDDRPYVGYMVADEADHGLDSMDMYPDDDETNRFGSGHDGEHWLTIPEVVDIRAIQGLTGTVLTYFAHQKDPTLYAVLIRLDRAPNFVLMLKDVQNLSALVRSAPQTSAGSTGFTKKNGEPLSKIKLKVGDLIGQTSSWPTFDGSQNKYGTFHFSLLRYDKAQEWRTALGQGALAGQVPDIAADSRIVTDRHGVMRLGDVPGPHNRAYPQSWFVAPCGSASPVRCK